MKNIGVLDILIVNYNTANLLAPMFAACERAAQGLQVRYWVVDNASRDESVAVLRSQFPFARLEVNAENVGFGRANNQLLRHVQGDYVLLLNTDAFVQPETLQRTLAYMDAHPLCGVLGVKLLGRDGALQPSCRYFPTPWNVFLSRTGLGRFFLQSRMVDDMTWDHASVRECDWVPGCYYLVRRQVLDQLGLFDPRYFLYYEEVDHCRRVKKAGWQVVYYPHTSVVHIGGESAKSEGEISATGKQLSALQIESEILYFRKFFGISGIVKHFIFTTIGDFYLCLKSLLTCRGRPALTQYIKHWLLTRHSLRKTAWGKYPTR